MLPEGVALDIITLGVSQLRTEDAEKVFPKYLPAAQHLEKQECDVIIAAGSIVFTLLGWDRSIEALQKIQDSVKVPVINNLQTHFDALDVFSAKKVALVTPYEDARNQERKKLLERFGYQVVSMKGLGLRRRIDIEKAPYYATYQLSKQAVAEAPDAEAIYISCPEWATIRNIEKIEKDTGIPVVAPVPSLIWAALKTMNIKASITGYGKLLELCER
ncbi:MAG: aspartate/glutamate racemase family protein [bacterium]